jgi:anti-sigma factor RsiW
MSCPHPLDAARLADYWVATLPPAEEEAVETHLLACDACGNRLREVIAMIDGIRTLARQGALQMIVTDAFVRRAEARGLRVRQYAPPAGGGVQCTIAADDDLLIGRLAADLSGAQRVDLSICQPDGREQVRLADIPFRAGVGEVVWQFSTPYAKAAPSGSLIARLIAVEPGREERLIGEYAFIHTRTIPGPAGW